MTVGERIRKYRTKKGWTQKKLGEKSNIAEPTIRRYELGKLNPKYETLEKIADALDCTPAYLMGWEEDYEFRDVPPGEPDNLEATKKWFALKQKSRLDEAYSKLNQTGQKEAVKRVEELTQIDKYKLSNDPDKE